MLRPGVWTFVTMSPLLVSFGCAGGEVADADRVVELQRRFQTASFLPADASVDGQQDDEPRLAVETRAAGQVLALPSSGRLVVPVDPFVGHGVLEFDTRFAGAAASGRGSLEISLLDDEGQRETLTVLTGEGENWTRVELALLGRRDALQFLVLDAVVPDESRGLELRSPRLRVSGGDEPVVERRPPGAGELSDSLPNVFILILDAARASNFGVSGYERETTPHIDEFARGGFVFSRAFSECPNTSCSIPNLISGVSFVDAGAPPAWHRLSDTMTTLAEYLVDIGYYTIGLSANPNNSVARNSHQGFDEFHEMWRWEGQRRRHPERRDPHRLSRRAIEAMQTVDDAQPVFMLLHYVPPHEPYAPRPEYDIFGDPTYDGSVRPGVLFRDVRQGRRTLSPADVEEMIALYDGNLRMADDAVGEVFEALKADARWANSIVLVTADHGEAFFEHGVHGHNSTLYDEMLHIPFILRLPHGQVPDHVDTDSLVILSDVVPTILGRVGLEPHGEVAGIDLLRADPPPGPRVIFQRRPGDRRFAARTLTRKALFSLDGRNPMLFDLATDPRELHNIVDVRPLLHQGFVALLRDHLLAAQARNTQSEGIELPAEDLRELRSLGYLR